MKKNLKIELIYRMKLIMFVTIVLFFILWNLIEHINNYLFFYTEINLNELEYIYYNNIYYANTNLNINIIEYDWYINYNIFPIYFANSKNTLVIVYIIMFLFLIVPYILYETYLFVIPACYYHEKKIIKNWVIYNLIVILFYLLYIDKIGSDFFFYWTEDSYIYIYNEWTDIFINIENLSNLYKFNILFFIFLTQYIYIHVNFIHKYMNIKISNKKLRILYNLFFIIFILILHFFINIEFLFLIKYVIIQLILTESLLYIKSIFFFIKK